MIATSKQHRYSLFAFVIGAAVAAIIATLLLDERRDPIYRDVFWREMEVWTHGSGFQQVVIDIGGERVTVDVVSQEREVAIGFTRDIVPGLAVNGSLESRHQWSCCHIENGIVAVGIQKPFFYSLSHPNR